MPAVKMPEHTLEQFMELFSYSPETGHFVHLVDHSKWGNSHLSRRGKRAGTVVGNGYRMLCVRGKRYLEHTAWRGSSTTACGREPLITSTWTERTTVSRTYARQRRPKTVGMWSLSRRNASGYKGVSLCSESSHAKGWRADIRVNNKRMFLGDGYTTPEAAHEVYCRAAAKLHGQFARTG